MFDKNIFDSCPGCKKAEVDALREPPAIDTRAWALRYEFLVRDEGWRTDWYERLVDGRRAWELCIRLTDEVNAHGALMALQNPFAPQECNLPN